MGHTLSFVHDAAGLVERRRRAHGDVFRMRVLGREGGHLPDPAGHPRDLPGPGQGALQPAAGSSSIGPLFRNGLMLRDFDDHHRHRRVMQQAFSRPR